MALGGGTFTGQNKKIPGAYINTISAVSASGSLLGERGTVAVVMPLNWGYNGIITITANEFVNNCKKLFGFNYDSEEAKPFREIFRNANKILIVRNNTSGSPVKATIGLGGSAVATAKYYGTSGNNLKIVISSTTTAGTYVVKTYYGTVADSNMVDKQTVTTLAISDFRSNDFVTFSGTGNATAGTYNLATGANGTVDHVAALTLLETKKFNTLCCTVSATDVNFATLLDTYINFTKRLNDELGIKFNLVLPVNNKTPDSEHVIITNNVVNNSGTISNSKNELCYWVSGADSACPINRSLTNKIYDGEYIIDWSGNNAYSQSELEEYIDDGLFTFHLVDDEFRVLSDINTYTSNVVGKSNDFKQNQTVRFIKQDATDTASIFAQKYIGIVQNNKDGRNSFWSDLVALNRQYQELGAIENFNPSDITVQEGEDKRTMVVNKSVKVVNAVEKLYMTTEIS